MEDVRKTGRFFERKLKLEHQDPDFFEFVREIENAEDGGPVGVSSEFRREPIRFGQMPALQFPGSMLADISNREKLLAFVYFFGLCGCNGPLPFGFTEYAYERSHNAGDLTLRRFMDIINHRFLGLYYRAWRKNELAVSMDDPDGGLITAIIRALSGDIIDNEAIPRYFTARWSNHLGFSPRSKCGLESILRETYHIPCKIREFEVTQTEIPTEYRCALGKRGTSELGRSVQLGSRCHSRTKKFTIEFGPLDFKDCSALLPGESGFRTLNGIIRTYLDRALDYDFKFIVRAESCPKTHSGREGRLGNSIWLGDAPHARRENRIIVIGASRLTSHPYQQRDAACAAGG